MDLFRRYATFNPQIILAREQIDFTILQAPIHTESLAVYETDVEITTTSSGEGHEFQGPVVKATQVVEQRISHFLMGLLIIGTMTGPLLSVLGTMPRAIFAGVFFVVGV